jgi:hypothetical protein
MNNCTWIGNSPTLQPSCCNPAVTGRSYCELHIWLVYQKGTHLSKRRKDQLTANSVRLWESIFNEAVEELVEEGEL